MGKSIWPKLRFCFATARLSITFSESIEFFLSTPEAPVAGGRSHTKRKRRCATLVHRVSYQMARDRERVRYICFQNLSNIIDFPPLAFSFHRHGAFYGNFLLHKQKTEVLHTSERFVIFQIRGFAPSHSTCLFLPVWTNARSPQTRSIPSLALPARQTRVLRSPAACCDHACPA